MSKLVQLMQRNGYLSDKKSPNRMVPLSNGDTLTGQIGEMDSDGSKSSTYLTNKAIAYIGIIVVIFAPLVYLFLPEPAQSQWGATYIGWIAGFFGGLLWILNEYGMCLKSVVLRPTEQHWVQVSARYTIGAASGATVVTLLSSLPSFAKQPNQAALGLIAGYSGVIIGVLASILIKSAKKYSEMIHGPDGI